MKRRKKREVSIPVVTIKPASRKYFVLRWIDANAQLMANFDVHVRARIFKMRVYLYDPTGG